MKFKKKLFFLDREVWTLSLTLVCWPTLVFRNLFCPDMKSKSLYRSRAEGGVYNRAIHNWLIVNLALFADGFFMSPCVTSIYWLCMQFFKVVLIFHYFFKISFLDLFQFFPTFSNIVSTFFQHFSRFFHLFV